MTDHLKILQHQLIDRLRVMEYQFYLPGHDDPEIRGRIKELRFMLKLIAGKQLAEILSEQISAK